MKFNKAQKPKMNSLVNSRKRRNNKAKISSTKSIILICPKQAIKPRLRLGIRVIPFIYTLNLVTYNSVTLVKNERKLNKPVG